MSTVECHIDAVQPLALVRLGGRLGSSAAARVGAALLRCLAEQPRALVVDMSELAADDPGALTVLYGVGARARVWPGVPIILCGARPGLLTAAGGRHVDLVRVCATREEALALAQRAPAPQRLRETLLPLPGAARRARDVATEACLRWRLDSLVADASVVAGELVANGTRHAGTMMGLTVARTSCYLHIAVEDGSSAPAVRATRGPDSGHGLTMVARTAVSWGCSPSRAGKVVWAALPAAGPPAR